LPALEEWQQRPLERVYPIVWMDAGHCKIKEDAEAALDKLDEQWGDIYPLVIKSWRQKWIHLPLTLNIQSRSGRSFIPPMRWRPSIDSDELIHAMSPERLDFGRAPVAPLHASKLPRGFRDSINYVCRPGGGQVADFSGKIHIAFR
jgi:hypothetical protein